MNKKIMVCDRIDMEFVLLKRLIDTLCDFNEVIPKRGIHCKARQTKTVHKLGTDDSNPMSWFSFDLQPETTDIVLGGLEIIRNRHP